jgi:hypothetical protein
MRWKRSQVTWGFLLLFENWQLCFFNVPCNRSKLHLEYVIPEPVEAELPDGISVRGEFGVAGPSFPAGSEVHMVQRAWVTVRAEEGGSYEDLLRTTTSFADLIGLAVGQPLRPLEMSGTCNARLLAAMR